MSADQIYIEQEYAVTFKTDAVSVTVAVYVEMERKWEDKEITLEALNIARLDDIIIGNVGIISVETVKLEKREPRPIFSTSLAEMADHLKAIGYSFDKNDEEEIKFFATQSEGYSWNKEKGWFE